MAALLAVLLLGCADKGPASGDGGGVDTSPAGDSGLSDSGLSDSGASDSGASDSGLSDSGLSDSGGDTGDTGLAAPAAPLRITELLADNESVLADADGDFSDWIELYNPGPDAVDLDGWGLSDDPADPFADTLPRWTLLPGEYVVVFASGKAASADPGELHVEFRLSADGESVVLTDPFGVTADRIDFGPQQPDISHGPAQAVTERVLVGEGSDATLAVVEEAGWQEAAHDDSSWLPVTLPLGFDTDEGAAVDENLALFAETDQSSDGYSRTGAQAVDDEWSTFSHTADGDLDPWWEVDLGDTRWVREVTILNRLDCCADRLYNLTVELRDDDDAVVWTSALLNPVAEGETPTSPGDTVDPGLEEGVAARTVRVSKEAVGGAGSSEWLSLAEVQVLGSPARPYADRIDTDVESAVHGVSDRAWVRARLPADVAVPDRLLLTLDADDGVVAWLGDEVARLGVGSDDAVSSARDAGNPVAWTVDPAAVETGVLALRVHNLAADDDDLLLAATLTAQDIETLDLAWFDPPTPGEPNGTGFQGFVESPRSDVAHGFADGAFTLTLDSPTPGATLAWTTDGSVPGPDNGTVIAPADDATPPSTTVTVETTTTLRAVAWKEGWRDSPVETWTWIDLDDVMTQPADPAGFPATWDGMAQAEIAADYEMDPDVVEDPAYADDLRTGLLAIPSLSVVMPPEDLFGEEAGLYVHSTQRGEEWERAASVELLLPDGGDGFQEDCGVRIHGYGWRPHSNTRKHSLRLEFRSEYDKGKLDYPLFPDAPVDRFDSIVLRAQGSRSWQDFRDPEQAQYIRDAFARDTAFAMGKDDGHAAYVHLYLNGLYWGLYMAVERPDADFAAERFGGDDDEWDAINRRTSTNEAIDGTLDAYNEMQALADSGLDPDELYVAIQDWLHLDDLIDYMLIHQYTVNKDGPEIFQSNNMRGARRRADGEQFRFFVWDMEYSIWEADDDYNIDVDVAGSISHVYAKLRESPDFRARYAERARMHLTDGGALTADAALARWEARATEIEDAVVAESARWGDADRETPYTRDVEWAEERRRLTEEFFPYRTEILIDQLTAAELYEGE